MVVKEMLHQRNIMNSSHESEKGGADCIECHDDDKFMAQTGSSFKKSEVTPLSARVRAVRVRSGKINRA